MKISFLSWIKNTVFSFVVAFEISIFFLLSFHLDEIKNEILSLAVVFVIISTVFNGVCFCYKKVNIKKMIIIPIVILLIYGLIIGSVFIIYSIGKSSGIDTGKEDFFSNKNVMIIVPHQDDEVLLSGGTIENYINYGSDVKIVFTTAGDYSDIANWRMEEAISVADYYGIKENNVIFLGYGNDWNADYHIYNAKDNELVKSANGLIQTYGLKNHKAFNDGQKYTRENFKNDIKNVVLTNKPDVIYCIDYDAHADHRATSLLFEEAMGEILTEQNTYKPTVYKGFAYSCSLKAMDDYAEYNNPSTINPYDTDYMQENNVYNWIDRVRVPTAYSATSNNIKNTSFYKTFELYSSQTVINQVGAVINSDHVYWERKTDSILYDAEITASSQNRNCLTDFKIYDSANIRDFENNPTDGVWVPTDNAKAINVNLKKSESISNIVIYDNPSLQDNVTSLKIVFDDNTEVICNNIFKNGAATVIPVNKESVKHFTVQILSGEGNKIGFTEIEAFSDTEKSNDVGLIKIVNNNDDFIYDYYFNQSETEEFSLYTYNCNELSEKNYSIISDNPKIKASINDNKIVIDCPNKENGKITIVSSDNNYSDTIYVFGKNASTIHKASLNIDTWLNRVFNISSEKKYIKDLIK